MKTVTMKKVRRVADFVILSTSAAIGISGDAGMAVAGIAIYLAWKVDSDV